MYTTPECYVIPLTVKGFTVGRDDGRQNQIIPARYFQGNQVIACLSHKHQRINTANLHIKTDDT